MEIGCFQEHIEFDVLPGEALMSIKALQATRVGVFSPAVRGPHRPRVAELGSLAGERTTT
jgi:hypothetical protein